MRRLRSLSEAECYARCYGGADDAVRVIRIESSRPPAGARRLSGEHVRRQFEERLDSRDPEAEAA